MYKVYWDEENFRFLSLNFIYYFNSNGHIQQLVAWNGMTWVKVYSTGFVFVGKVTSWVELQSAYLHWEDSRGHLGGYTLDGDHKSVGKVDNCSSWSPLAGVGERLSGERGVEWSMVPTRGYPPPCSTPPPCVALHNTCVGPTFHFSKKIFIEKTTF